MCLNGERTRAGFERLRPFGLILLLLASLFAAAPAYARGGQAADDCPPGSKDPDCVKK